ALEKRPADTPPAFALREAGAVPDRPEGAPVGIRAAGSVLPIAIVAHEVVEPAVGRLRVMEKGEVNPGQALRRLTGGVERYEKAASHVVGAVAARAVGNVVNRVLDDPDVVGQRGEMVERRGRPGTHPTPVRRSGRASPGSAGQAFGREPRTRPQPAARSSG